MSTRVLAPERRLVVLATEVRKLPAFLRRDFRTALSYRMSFFTDIIGLGVQVVMFYFVGLMVNPDVLPTYGGNQASYMQFVTIGIALSAFMAIGLGRVAGAVRGEQLMGTLESLLMTPTSPVTIQLGSVVYDLVYIPIRTAVFLVLVAVTFGIHFDASGLLPALVFVVFFIPFVWGIGVMSAGALLTFKRGGAGIGLGVTLLTLTSGAYFPLDLFPDWVATIAEYNPMAVAIQGMREALLGGTGWSEVAPGIALLAPMALASLVIGFVVFRLALRRERRLGTLGLY